MKDGRTKTGPEAAGRSKALKGISHVMSGLFLLTFVIGCGGGGGGESVPEYRIGGALTGLAAGQDFLTADERKIVLRLNGKYDLALAAGQSQGEQAFSFNERIAQGMAYKVTIARYPLNHLCDLVNGEGTAIAEVTDIEVICRETRLNDTGIDWWANGAATRLTTSQGDYPGQEADYGRDAYQRENKLAKHGAGDAGFDFTKLDAGGNELTGKVASWNCVRDNVTGLIWRMEEGNNLTWSAAEVYAGTAAPACGVTEWRLPTVQELASLVDSGENSPAVDTNFFPSTHANPYWTATEAATGQGDAWYFDFANGGAVGLANKDNLWVAKLVGQGREEVANRFTASDDQITDHQTGLMWLLLANDTPGTWEHALARAQAINQSSEGGGYTDWRLPNRQELVSLINYQNNNPAIDQAFAAVTSSSYWTSSPATIAGLAWYVDFGDGYVGVAELTGSKYSIFVRNTY